MLRKYINQFDQLDWDKYVHLLGFAENKAISRSHGFQPDYLMFGREPTKLLELESSENMIEPKDYEQRLLFDLKEAWKKANQVLKSYQNEMINARKKELGKRKPASFQPGDYVWLNRPDNAFIKDNAVKLHSRAMDTPYQVKEVDEHNNVKIAITPSQSETVPPHQLRKAKNQEQPKDQNSLQGKFNEVIIIRNPPLAPTTNTEVMVIPPENLDVESIVGKRIAVYWSQYKKWYRGIVIGYTTTKSANLVYYDDRHPDCPSQEDFYLAPLFKTATRAKTEKWKLLVVRPSSVVKNPPK
jgi:hypothetical protein